ncbi:MAG: Spy/CpxP family protein refolding chaperone [Betaproteobacteria bacterium]|nr:Spy/CpxP family protein refolding chaperone [Betaproteobacteria bacterium]MDH3436247.1 Spy/CpxP family protein refolding chaperone [Betaproteobacteria bacterium]
MKKMLIGTLVTVSLAAAAAPLVLAQTALSGTDGPRAERLAHRHGHGQRAMRLPSERIEARLAYLKTALKITDAQEAQWNSFADALRQHTRGADERFKARHAQRDQNVRRTPPTAIERMERRQARLAAAAERLKKTLTAAKPLYAALSPEQQQIADELFARRGRGFRHHGWHHRG